MDLHLDKIIILSRILGELLGDKVDMFGLVILPLLVQVFAESVVNLHSQLDVQMYDEEKYLYDFISYKIYNLVMKH